MTVLRLQYSLLLLLLIPCWIIASNYDIDLVNLHVAAGFTHTDLSRVYAQNGNYGRWFYPPFSLVLIYPLGDLPYLNVKWFWICLQTVSYVFFWYGLYQLYPVLKRREFFWGWLLVYIVAINPIHNNYQSNNVQLMLIAVLIMSELMSRKKEEGWQILAGTLVSFATWFKVFPAFMAAYYFFYKPTKVRVGVLIGFFIGLLLPFAFFGIDNGTMLYKDFYLGVTTYGNENSLTKTPDIMCLPSLIDRFFTYVVPLPSFWLGFITKILSLIFAALFFVIAFFSARTSTGVWALAMALTVFLNPSTRPHYFIFYVPAFLSLLEEAWKKRTFWNLGPIVFCVLLVAFTTDAVLGKPLNDQLEFLSFPTIGTGLVVFLLGLGLLFRTKPVEAEI